MQTSDYDKISVTAKIVAHARQFSDIPFAHDIANYIDAARAMTEVANDVPKDGRNLAAPLVEARYKSISKFIQQNGFSQVLEIASGFTLRGLAFCKESTMTYVESDLAQVTKSKQVLIQLIKQKYDLGTCENYYPVTANALNQQEILGLLNLLDTSKPIAIITEGLIPYLTQLEQTLLAQNVRCLLSRFVSGYWITPDFITKTTANRALPDTDQQFREAVNQATQRPLHQDAFETEQDIENFIDEQGFTFRCVPQLTLVDALVSAQRLNIQQNEIDHLKPRMNLWILAIK